MDREEQTPAGVLAPPAPIPEELVEGYVRDWLRSTLIPFARPIEERLVSEVTVLLVRFPGVER